MANDRFWADVPTDRSWPAALIGILNLNGSSMWQRSRSTQYGSPLWQLTQLLDDAEANQGAHLRDRDGV